MQVHELFRNSTDIHVFTFFAEHPIQSYTFLKITEYLNIPAYLITNSLHHFVEMKIIHSTNVGFTPVHNQDIYDMFMEFNDFKILCEGLGD